MKLKPLGNPESRQNNSEIFNKNIVIVEEEGLKSNGVMIWCTMSRIGHVILLKDRANENKVD